jgi:hypothetical protein
MKRSRLFAGAIGALATIALLAAGCGGGDGDPTPAATSEPSPTATATATRTPATPTATPTITPTPTPVPYTGAVVRLKIPRFGIDAPIEELGVNSANQLDTPRAENTGVAWYYLYDRPGAVNPDNDGWYTYGGRREEMKAGNAVFSAHVYYHNVPAPFQNLAQSQPGDKFIVTMEDGREYTYEMIRYNRYPEAGFPMAQVLWPEDKPLDEEWITMITCGGRLSGQDYLDREVVVARRVS